MKVNRLFIVAVLLLAMTSFAGVSAKNKCVPKMYAFGFAASFNDSTVHFTEVQELDSVWIDEKTDFLLDRQNYSYQLKSYFERQGMPHRTCVIRFAQKRKDIDKMYQKMKEKYTKRSNIDIKYVSGSEFKFETIKFDNMN